MTAGGNSTTGGDATSNGDVGGTSDTGVNAGGTTSVDTTSTAAGGTGATDGGSEPECASDVLSGIASGNTVRDCGACGVVCSVANANSATCVNGTCAPACTGGFGDCNSSTQNDGCETDVTTTTNCGKCGRACSTIGTKDLYCAGGLCAPTCSPKYADCHPDNGSNDDGCETYLDSLTQCGSGCANAAPCPVNQVCNGGTCGVPQGLVMLSIPFASTGQSQRYADKFPTYPNLSNTVLTMRVYAPGATNGTLTLYMVDLNTKFGPRTDFSLDSLSHGWTDLTINIGSYDGAFDPRVAYQVTVEIVSTGASWASPTLIYVDSVRTSNSVLNDTFDASVGYWVPSTLMMVSGSTFSWVDQMPADVPDSGA